MNDIDNPFFLTKYVSPEYFCDREEETRSLISSLKNGRNITLRSPRRIGKTGLIKNAFYYIQDENKDTACFYIDLMSTKCLTDFVKCFGEKVIGRGLDFEPKEAQHTLQQIFDYIKQSDKTCYIAFDEFQQIAEYPEKNVEALLRTHVQECQNVQFIFSGSKQHLLTDMFSSPKRPFYRSTEKMGLDILDKEKYYEFAKRFFAQKGVELEEKAFEKVLVFSDGVTWHTQYLLNRLYEVCREDVKEKDVIEAMQYILEREKDDYQRIVAGMTKNQLDLARAIAKDRCAKEPTAKEFIKKHRLGASSSIFRALQHLLDDEVVYKSEEGYIVYDRFFGLWLREQ